MCNSKYLIVFGIIVSVFLMLFTCQHRTDKPESEQATLSPTVKVVPASDTTTSFAEVSENTRIALLLPCGRCHQSTLASHKPGAIEIFNLDAGELWHSQLNEERLSGLDRRTKGSSTLSEEERAQIAEFVAMKRARLQ